MPAGFSPVNGSSGLGLGPRERDVLDAHEWLDAQNSAAERRGDLVGYASGGLVGFADGGAPNPYAEFAAPGGGANPYAEYAPTAKPASSHNSSWAAPVTDIWPEIYKAGAESLSTTNDYLNPFSAAYQEGAAKRMRGEGDWTGPGTFLGTGKGLLSAVSVPFSPLTGAARSVIGHPMSWMMPTATPEEQQRMRARGASESMIPGGSTAENYERVKPSTDAVVMGVGARPRFGPARPLDPNPPQTLSEMVARNRAERQAATPTPPAPGAPGAPEHVGDFNVPLSTGEASGNVTQWQNEQLALRGGMGDRAQQVAQRHLDERNAVLDATRTDIAREMDPHGGNIFARDPQQAGELVSDAVRTEAANRRAAYKGLYDEFTSAPGEFEPGTFQKIGPSIVKRLENRADPIILDEASRAVAPNAHRALNFLDSYFGEGHGPVGTAQIDRVGKALVSFYLDSKAVPADKRATTAVLDAFGKHIDAALDAGLFSGDERAIQTWKNARAAFADYKRTFGPQGPGDDVGRAVAKILGKYGEGSEATATEVANYLYGATSVGAKGSSVRIAERVRDILGPQSPEWAGVKQGLWAKLTEATQGRTDWGPQKVSERINEFLHGEGKPMADRAFSAPERDLMERYANLLKRLVPPPGSVNTSNTAPILKRIMDHSGTAVKMIVGGTLGHLTGIPVAEAVGAVAGFAMKGKTAALSDRLYARKIANNFPTVEFSVAKWQRAQDRLARADTEPNRRAVTFATSNLSRSLESIGVDPSKVFGAQNVAPVGAEEQPARASGGRVVAQNIDARPTEAQKAAGNYAMDHVSVHGLDLTIENAKGSTRSGVDKGGKPWRVVMPAAYGYIKGTVGKDKDHIDVYLGPDRSAPHVYVIDQKNADTGRFDEHKCCIGFPNRMAALATYRKGFSDGRGGERLGRVTTLPVALFKQWLAVGDPSRPLSAQVRT